MTSLSINTVRIKVARHMNVLLLLPMKIQRGQVTKFELQALQINTTSTFRSTRYHNHREWYLPLHHHLFQIMSNVLSRETLIMANSMKISNQIVLSNNISCRNRRSRCKRSTMTTTLMMEIRKILMIQ